MLNFTSDLINPRSRRTFEERVLILSLIIAVIITGSISTTVLKYGFPLDVSIVTYLATVFTVVLLAMAINGKYLTFIKNAFVFAFPVITGYMWFYKEGLYGSVPALILVNSFISILIISKNRLLVTALFSLEFIGLLSLQILFPELISPYPTPEAKFYCLTTSYVSVGLLSALLMVMFKKAYEAERAQVFKDKNYSHLQNEETKKLNRQLEALIEQKDKFLSIISHDSRTPIKNIGGLLQMLNSNDISIEEFKKFLPSLEENIKETSAFMDNLLMYSKAQKGLLTPNQKLIDLSTLIDGIIRLYNISAKQKNIHIKYDNLIQDLVKADEDMLNIIIRNLIQNALKFTPENGIISLQSELKNDYLVLSVKDNGVGMSSEKIAYLFEKNSDTTGVNTKGGLGLKLVQDFVKIQKGKLHIISTPGKGSEFLVKIPA